MAFRLRNRNVRACDLNLDGVEFRAGSQVWATELTHPAHRGQPAGLATFGFTCEYDRSSRVQVFELFVRFARQDISKPLDLGANFVT